MKFRFRPIMGVAALAAAFAVLSAPTCWAQLGGPGLSGNGVGPAPDISGGKGQEQAAPRAQAPALPGAKSDPSRVAPATKQASEMNPNDAMFDAINRGDIGAARDALNRGAELGAHNVLGMTPMELAIDLSRNDIAFLLLSMRGAEPGARSAVAAAAAKAGAGKGAPPAKPMREVRATKTAVPRVAVAPAQHSARLFAGGGGTPVPASGFLGFGGSGGN